MCFIIILIILIIIIITCAKLAWVMRDRQCPCSSSLVFEENGTTNGTLLSATMAELRSTEASNLISLITVPCLPGHTKASWGIAVSYTHLTLPTLAVV